MGSAVSGFRIERIEHRSLDIPITHDFTISKGKLDTAEVVIVRIYLEDSSVGYGEIAPFPALTGETRQESLAAVEELSRLVVGRSVLEFRAIAEDLRRRYPNNPAVRCGIETAVVDALCRATSVPLWALWGGAAVREYTTDITLPISSPELTLELGHGWYERGFRIFKLKVGSNYRDDCERVRSVATELDDISLIIDANQGYSLREALGFAKELEALPCQVVAFEQPVDRLDLNGMRTLRKRTSIPIAADESVFTLEDARRVIDEGAADIVNLKIMKTGLIETVEIASLCRSNGVGLMIGGMVETRVAMGCSFSLVLGLGTIRTLDLDTPLLLSSDPVEGGYSYSGPTVHPWYDAGLGMSLAP